MFFSIYIINFILLKLTNIYIILFNINRGFDTALIGAYSATGSVTECSERSEECIEPRSEKRIEIFGE